MGILNHLIEVFQTTFQLNSPSTSPLSRNQKKPNSKSSNEYKNKILLKKSSLIRKKVINKFFNRNKKPINKNRNEKYKFQNLMLDNNNEGGINKYEDIINVRRVKRTSRLKKNNEKFNVNFQDNSNIKDNLMKDDGSDRKGKLMASNFGSFNPTKIKNDIASKSTESDTENVKDNFTGIPKSDMKNKVPKFGDKRLNLDVKPMGQSDFKNKMSKNKESVLKNTETSNLSKISKSELNNKISSLENGNSPVPGVNTSILESLNTNETKNQVSAFDDLELQTQTSSFSFSGEPTEEIPYKPHFIMSTLPDTTEKTVKENVSDKTKKSTDKSKKKKEPVRGSKTLNTLDNQEDVNNKSLKNSIKNIESQESLSESSVSTSVDDTSKDTESIESKHFLLTNSSPSSVSTSEILTKQSSNLFNKQELKQEPQKETKRESKRETKQELKQEPQKETKPESKKETKQELKQELKQESKKETKQDSKKETKPESKKETKLKDKSQATNTKLAKPEKETKDKSKLNTKLDGDDSKKQSLKKELDSQNLINHDQNITENVTSTKVKNLKLKKEIESSKEPISNIGKNSINGKKSKDKSIFGNKSVKSDKNSKKNNDENVNLKSATETSSSVEVSNKKNKMPDKVKDTKTSVATMDSKAKSMPESNQTSTHESEIAENSVSKVSENIQTIPLRGQSKTTNGESSIEPIKSNDKPDKDGKQCDELSDLFINNREDLRNINLGMHCRICESIFDCCCNCGCLMDENRIPVFSALKCKPISKTKCCRPLRQNLKKSICRPKLSWECKRPFYSSSSSDSLTLSYNCIVGDEIYDNYCPQRMICISR